MLVNNEVGSLQDIPALARIARERDALFHTDAVQALNCYGIDVDDLGVDLLSLSGHKIYGPKGIGALYVRKGTPIDPIQFGGTQESGLRPGTENVPGIVGLGAAIALRNTEYAGRYQHVKQLREQFVLGLQKTFPDAIMNVAEKNHAPHIVSVSFPGLDGELLLFYLNQQGVAVSMGSACTSKSIEPSHVLSAMGLAEAQIEGTIRISFGLQTTEAEVDELLNLLPQTVEQARI
jgi:cysteine desulfurase